MLRNLIVVFLIVLTIILFGFGGSLAAGALPAAKILFYTFVGLVVLSLLLGPSLFRKR